ncbi:hypothetical protein N7507_009691 [Penicillium longicatenatum]|nr:hypothetical protein N7507_009691 [Penicillium longicatenatum]
MSTCPESWYVSHVVGLGYIWTMKEKSNSRSNPIRTACGPRHGSNDPSPMRMSLKFKDRPGNASAKRPRKLTVLISMAIFALGDGMNKS